MTDHNKNNSGPLEGRTVENLIQEVSALNYSHEISLLRQWNDFEGDEITEANYDRLLYAANIIKFKMLNVATELLRFNPVDNTYPRFREVSEQVRTTIKNVQSMIIALDERRMASDALREWSLGEQSEQRLIEAMFKVVVGAPQPKAKGGWEFTRPQGLYS